MLPLVMDCNSWGRWRRAKWAVADNQQEMWRGAVRCAGDYSADRPKSKENSREMTEFPSVGSNPTASCYCSRAMTKLSHLC